jgi:hypothetical protein
MRPTPDRGAYADPRGPLRPLRPTRHVRRPAHFHDQDRLTANRHGKSVLIMKEAATPWQARLS